MRKATPLAALGLASAVMLTACASGAAEGGSSAEPEPSTATLGIFTAPTVLQAGLAWGLFDDLPMEMTVIDSGPAALPLVKRGDMAGIVDLSATPLMVGETSEIPLKIVWMTSGATYDLVVSPDITSAEDLVGKNIAIVPGSILEYVLDKYLEEHGVDPATVKKVDLPPPSMPAALSTGQIDGAFVWEPFSSQMVESGGTSIAEDSDRGLVVFGADYVEQYPENVQAVVCSVAASAERFLEDPDAAYEAIGEQLGQPAEGIAAAMPSASVLEPSQANADDLGDGTSPSKYAADIAAIGDWLASQDRIPYAPTVEDVENLFDPSFAIAVDEGACE
ncbi:ABC transporter substrate-binding protein [Agromyces aerolatus]|uniref:ABC transporter substrate-binding protein n=1 Tax=Agromyces sp. LY-1074 TaxID=3074080 RepID=UPI002864AEC1|nr:MULTISPECIES: ABC transporter substrate-binding protein [unclassified Agromyces]MDR5701668.1 ABC transporter substrate-binding protein [Agromyces sp. LY-1074]MDR5707892.1 ABC transporter substrate-binding protein [Agromyces sp. LY-1358]